MPSASCAHRLETKFNSPSEMSHVFKIKISVFQVMTLAERKKDSLTELCYVFNEEFRVFLLGPLPKIKS
jgi:hypothetical protein